jgi:hypothetical protein
VPFCNLTPGVVSIFDNLGLMIEKLEFYHGAALVRLIEDPRCETITKHECGYLVNESRIVMIKYSTKGHSPWGFTFSTDDITRIERAEAESHGAVVALVCGGDGICALLWMDLENLLSNAPGRIGAKRGFAGCYAVSGPVGKMKRKVAMNRWPAIVFDGGSES